MSVITTTLTAEIVSAALNILKNYKSKADLIEKLPDSNTLSRKQAVQKLAQYFKDGKLVFVLGAGVSMGFGLPDWNVLLQKLMITTIEQEENVSTVLSQLFTKIFSPSPLVAGRYLQKYYEDKKMVFEEAVRKVLYEEMDINKKSPLMDEIVSFCVAPGKSPNLDSIITYNFDDILEQRLGKVGIEVPHKPIYGLGMSTEDKLPIYHVHGYLQQKGKIDDQNQITFGESVYHKQYVDIYSWNNIVQINKFRDGNCLFIGSSLTDPNIRRLLDIAKKQKGAETENHFVFKIRYKEEEVKSKLEFLLKDSVELLNAKIVAEMNLDDTVRFLIQIIERFEEADKASFGVRTIWVNDWTEVPEILKEVRKMTK